MFGSTVLDVAFGLIFVYYALALLCAGVVEMIANWVRKRAKFLFRGVQDLIDGIDQQGKFWAQDPLNEYVRYRRVLKGKSDTRAPSNQDLSVADVFGHPLVLPFRQTTATGRPTRQPSYVPASVFAAVLTDLLTSAAVDSDNNTDQMARLVKAVKALPAGNDQLRQALEALIKVAGDDLTAFRKAVETWFDSQMDRITGSYKRWAKRWVIVIAAVVVGVGGVDSIAIARSLYTDEAVRTAVVQAAGQAGELCPTGTPDADCAATAKAKVEALGLPIGWSGWPKDGNDWALKLVGLLLSVGAAALGAPFWYKLLDRVGTLRNTGTPPS